MNLDTLSSGLQRSAPTVPNIVLHFSDLAQFGYWTPSWFGNFWTRSHKRRGRVRQPRLLRFPVDTVLAPSSLAEQVGTMELRAEADATTESAQRDSE